MNYTKPEVRDLGKAVRVIEQVSPPKISPNTDANGVLTPNSAYDLDE
jgi:hypothetical protein